MEGGAHLRQPAAAPTPSDRGGGWSRTFCYGQCYATMTSILAASFPEKAPHFLAHLRTVIQAAHNFDGGAWATYDAVCRRHAANRGSLDWGAIDNAIYSEAFTGRARVILRPDGPYIAPRGPEGSTATQAAIPVSPEGIPPPGGVPPLQRKYVLVRPLQARPRMCSLPTATPRVGV